MKRSLGILFIVLVQVTSFIFMVFFLDSKLSIILYPIITVLSFIVALYIFYDYTKSNTSKLSWLILILTIPVVGFIFYLIFGRGNMSNYKKQQMYYASNIAQHKLCNLNSIEHSHGLFKDMSHYLKLNTDCSTVSRANVKLIDDGNDKLRMLLEDIKKATSYIHMEYYIVKDGYMWQMIEHALMNRAMAGVEVKLLVDWAGAILLSDERIAQIKKHGIEIRLFNKPSLMVFSKALNYRDHRKIVVIDGIVGYMGGFNIGDEYLNLDPKFGNWQDIHVRLEGCVVHTLQSIFSANWYFETRQAVDRSHLQPVQCNQFSQDLKTQCCAFDDGPYLDAGITKDIYFKLISSAKHSIKIATPYLIPEAEILTALIIAAKSGVDVQIITPGKPDKIFVKLATQSYYSILLKSGVRISEYQNGFMHAKKMMIDDEVVILGTTNLDMRSLNLNFEINLLLGNDDQMIDDFLRIFQREWLDSDDVILDVHLNRSLFYKVGGVIMRLFAPLL